MLALVGWFILNAASAERNAGLADQLAGLVVGEVMTPDPILAPSWLMVDAFVGRLTPSQLAQPFFPLVGFDGQPEGVLTLPELQRVPAGRRGDTRLREVGRRRTPPLVVTAQAVLADVIAPLRRHGGVAVVMDDGHVVGVLTRADLTRATNLARFGRQAGGAR